MPIERTTRQRDAIKSAILDARRPLSPGEVLDAARAAVNALGIATVYRTLKLLVAEGAVEVITLPGESPRYEMAASIHHHHFQCNACRPFSTCPVARAIFVASRRADFRLSGTMSRCTDAARVAQSGESAPRDDPDRAASLRLS